MDGLATTADIEALAAIAARTGKVGVDTEFMGEGRYRSLLCVVQAAVVEDGVTTSVVIDALDETVDATALAETLADPAIEVIMHACRQDVPLLRRSWDTPITNLFDTQVAAGFAGLRAQMGYDALLHELLRISVRKGASYTKWDKRPLTSEQVVYARDDVAHLVQAAEELQRRLTSSGRLAWAYEECRPLAELSDSRDPDAVFAKLPRINGLDPQTRAVALALVSWREETARTGDRPASTVLNDQALVEIAKRRPQSMHDLEQIRGVNPGALRRKAQPLLDAVALGVQGKPVPSLPSNHDPTHPDDASLIVVAEALVRALTRKAELAYELVATRADLQAMVTAVRSGRPTGPDETSVRTLHGWRRALVGNEILELFAGRRALLVGPDLSVRVQADDDPTTAT